MTKNELRAAVAALDIEITAAKKAAEPARAVLKPFLDALDVLEERKELLLEENETLLVGKCDGCSKVLFEGELGTRFADSGGYLCEECSPTIADALKNMRDNRDELDPDDFDAGIAHLEGRIAAGESPDTICASPL